MKKLFYILPIAALTIISCGGGGNDNAEGDAMENSESAEMTGTSTDLSEHGMDYTIVLPEKKNLITDIAANDWGGIEIRQGEVFLVSIAYGEGDVDLLKFDLEEDLVYKAEILEESEDHILYKKEIEGSGMDPEYHFLYVHRLDGDAIEIQNLKDVSFNEEQARAMLNAAKTFAPKSGA